MQDLNSNSFEIQMGLNQDQDLEVPKNVEDFGGAWVSDERIIDKVWRLRSEITKALGFICKCVMINSE